MSPNFDATRWPQCLSEQPSAQTQLIKQLPLVRAQYVQLVCELTLQCGATAELAKPQKVCWFEIYLGYMEKNQELDFFDFCQIILNLYLRCVLLPVDLTVCILK